MRPLRALAPLLIVSGVALSASSTASAAPLGGGRASVSAAATSAPNGGIGRTGREGSIGIGRFRLFHGKEVSSSMGTAGAQTKTSSRSWGFAIVKKPGADGAVSAKGMVNTKWQSETKAGGQTTTMSGSSSIKGGKTNSTWSAQTTTNGKSFVTSGTEHSAKGETRGRWVTATAGSTVGGTYSKVGSDTTTTTKDYQTGQTFKSTTSTNPGLTKTTTESHNPQTQVTTTTTYTSAPTWSGTKTVSHDGTTGKTTRSSDYQQH